jgi:hypothetical protein
VVGIDFIMVNIWCLNYKKEIMATLETQYKNYLIDNPESTLTFDEWKEDFGTKIMTSMQKIMDEINRPEFKQEQIDKNQKYLEDLSIDHELGYYVGENIVNRYLPTLSTDMIHSNRIVDVSEEDTLENKRLDTEWFSTTRHMPNWDGKTDGDNEKWEKYQQHNKMLEKKYLPNPLECYLGLIKINDMNEFKKGLSFSLWDCDMCSYNIEPENIKIENDMVNGFTIITFQLD